jgi:hypothetical protein
MPRRRDQVDKIIPKLREVEVLLSRNGVQLPCSSRKEKHEIVAK